MKLSLNVSLVFIKISSLFQLPVKVLDFLLGLFIMGCSMLLFLYQLLILLLCFDIRNFKLGMILKILYFRYFWILWIHIRM